MAQLSIQQMSIAGIVPSYAAATIDTGDLAANNGKTFLHVKNGGASPINVTVASNYNNPPAGTAQEDIVVAVANGSEKMIGPFNMQGYNTVDGNIEITYSAVISVTIAAIST